MAYYEEGTNTITCSISGPGGPQTQTATAVVADAPLTTTNIGGMSISATAGQQFSGQLMSFSDQDPQGVAGDYSVQVDWGDGTLATGGSVTDYGNQSCNRSVGW